MMYLPYKQGEPELSKFFVEMFGLVKIPILLDRVKMANRAH